MSFVNFRLLLTVLFIGLLSFNLTSAQSLQGESVRAKLATITPIKLDLEGVTLVEAVEMLKNITSAKGMSDFNIIYDLSSQEGLAEKTANLYLERINADFALEQILQTFGVIAIYDDYAIKLIPSQGNNMSFISKKWQVTPVFFKDLAQKVSGDPNSINTVAVQKPIDILRQLGVDLPEGSSIIYLASSNFLEVRAPAQSIEIIDQFIIEAKQREASQVSLKIKYITIKQDELDELGFDWVTGGFTNITGGANISDTVNANLLDTTTNLTTSPTQAVTAGNRTITELGDFNKALDDLVGDMTRIQDGSTQRNRTPGVLSYIDNLESSEQVSVMLRALSQAKSFDVMEVPHVVVKSGQKGTFFKGTEIRYPTAYDQAEISESDSRVSINSLTGEIFNIVPSTFSVTPSHPTDFETQKLGIELMIEPTLSSNNQLINLNINPKFHEFQGFLSFGERMLNVSYYTETYPDNDGDGIVLVGVNSDGRKVVIENVLGGLQNSLVFIDSNGNGFSETLIDFNNSISISGSDPTTFTVINKQGNVDTYTSTLLYFYYYNNENIVTTAFAGFPIRTGVLDGDTFHQVVFDLDINDQYLYTIEGTGNISTISGIGYISFVDPDDFDIYEATPNFVVQPIFNKTELNTQATIKSGETVLIGGLMQQNKIALDDSVPLLGDIPLLGRLFNNEGEDASDTAILIFVEAVAQDPLGNPVSE